MHVWRTRLGTWFAPLARRCPLSPNAITIIALLLNVVAAGCLYFGGERPWLFLVAIVFIAVGGLLDAFDGIVAREQQRQTRYGDFLDHFADRVSDVLLAACWMMGNDVHNSLTILTVIMIMLNGYIGTQIEATWRQRNYDTVGRGEFVLALIVYPIVSYILFSNGWAAIEAGGLTVAEWMTLVLVVFGLVGIAQRFVVAARLERS
ncbi:MAG TPA: CDP-alcohol phosphatidyltransferase family protein [Thermoanaerobaculia bacterium]|nr:CDP-alcohol phosphatidyltransferase family protein [Thermoanaerobaculia bacterium]